MALIGNIYTNPSSSDPGAVGYGYGWFQSDTGNMYWRNTTNTAWVLAGNTDQTYMGLLSRSGGTMTGAILGAHGLMPTSGGDFSVAPTITGNTIATVPYVDAQVAAVNATISTQIAQAIASIPGLSVASKLAIGCGISSQITMSGGVTSTGTYTIPLPTYGDGTTATQAEVTGKYSAWVAAWNFGDNSISAETSSFALAETPANSRTFQLTYTNNSGIAVPTPFPQIGYVIVGVKS